VCARSCARFRMMSVYSCVCKPNEPLSSFLPSILCRTLFLITVAVVSLIICVLVVEGNMNLQLLGSLRTINERASKHDLKTHSLPQIRHLRRPITVVCLLYEPSRASGTTSSLRRTGRTPPLPSLLPTSTRSH